MRLASRIKSLERCEALGTICRSCGMPRHGLPVGARVIATAPRSVAHIRQAAGYVDEPIDPPCGVCGRPRAFRIPMPDRAREEAA